MIDEHWSRLSLNEAAEAISNREVSSEELILQSIELLEGRNPELNCVAGIEAEKALDDAKSADKEMHQGKKRGPLHGVPLAHKDMFYRAGRVSGCGSRIFQHHLPKVTATVLKKLDASGALDIARLKMVEFAYGLTGHNDIHGLVHNPWNPEYITGESSSGPASAVAAQLFFSSLGSVLEGRYVSPPHAVDSLE